MEAIDHFPLPEAEYNHDKFKRNFLLMDAALGAVECDIEYAQRHGNTTKMAIAISEGKRMITYMLQYVAHAYFASKGSVTRSPIFSEYELNFPYRAPELWQVVKGKQAPRHDDVEPEPDEVASIERAITLQIDKTEI